MASQEHTNKLINETSPYLLQHAHNPVNWYPWGPEALERSRADDKPILLSIGYSACHWCHAEPGVAKRQFCVNDTLRCIHYLFDLVAECCRVEVDRATNIAHG